ncbi:hypothetical protein [Mesorhizobium sp. Cs1321R2N1]|uniref:hypothetical protein n=1 Tax=Mesorhizobium sp. Cs1321R2N1 TaxID=3015174 RepID=UPI00301E58E6
MPEAAPAIGDVSVVYQGGGEYEGQYLVTINQEGRAGIVYVMLRPRFDFCGDVSSLDDGRSDLFEVVVAISMVDGSDQKRQSEMPLPANAVVWPFGIRMVNGVPSSEPPR